MVDRGRLDISKHLSVMDPPRIRSMAPSDKIEFLSSAFSPNLWDVVCQGGKDSFDHIGNKRFRVCIDNNLDTYMKARTKHERSAVVTIIVDTVRDSCAQEYGGFVRKDLGTGRWYAVGDKVAREKVGHALRDAIKLRGKKMRADNTMSSILNRVESRPLKRRRREATSTFVPQNDLDEVLSSPRIDKTAKALSGTTKKVEHPDEAPSPEIVNGSRHMRVRSLNALSGSDPMEREWENSLKASIQVFENSNADSVLGSIVAHTCLERKPHAFQEAPKMGGSLPTADPIRVSAVSALDWSPPGLCNAEDVFSSYMKRFAPTPILDQEVVSGEMFRVTKPPCRSQKVSSTDGPYMGVFCPTPF